MDCDRSEHESAKKQENTGISPTSAALAALLLEASS
jgi:hypothetical protein